MKRGALPGDWKPDLSNSLSPDLGARHFIGNPIHIYPLFENGFRASRGQSVMDNHWESASVRQCLVQQSVVVAADRDRPAICRVR
jgi:hypothetical protein